MSKCSEKVSTTYIHHDDDSDSCYKSAQKCAAKHNVQKAESEYSKEEANEANLVYRSSKVHSNRCK